MGLDEFIKERLGPNWAVGRRTKDIVQRYGKDVICVSLNAYRRIYDEWDKQTSCPHCGAAKEHQRKSAD